MKGRTALAVALSFGAASGARAQHEHGAAGAPAAPAMGSGTAWLPDAAPMRAVHAMAGSWSLMIHGAAFVQYVREFGTREADQLGSINWLMIVATHGVAGGALQLRAMASAEPLTVGGRGYPELLQTAVPYKGVTVSDRQHPHDALSEAAVAYDRGAVSFYAAAVGEPALGPVVYSHRPSAIDDPVAPLGHHIQDLTHITPGVVTVGVGTRHVKVEAYYFNAAHGDDVWTDVDPIALNAYAGRLSFKPSLHWSISAWAGHLPAVSGTHAHGSLDRFGAAAIRAAPFGGRGGMWSTTVMYAAEVREGTSHPLNSLLVESTLELDRSNAVFARAEYVRRTSEDLALIGSISEEVDIGALSGGYTRTIAARGRWETALGVRGVVRFVPAELDLFYGSRTPVGVLAYLVLRPGSGL